MSLPSRILPRSRVVVKRADGSSPNRRPAISPPILPTGPWGHTRHALGTHTALILEPPTRTGSAPGGAHVSPARVPALKPRLNPPKADGNVVWEAG